MLRLFAHGVDPDDLDEQEKVELAQHVHDYLREDLEVPPETVAVEGYGDD